MADRLKGKVAFCTASGAGIGRATAIAFAREGARVIASDIDEAAFADLKAAGVAECVRLDGLDTAAVEAQAQRLGPIDVLFNAVGFVHHGTVLDCSDADWDRSFDINVKSMHRTIKAFLPGMLSKGGGSIVNIASTASSIRAAPNRYVYGATKAAIIGLTKAVAMDFIAKGIRCNCICPGTIQSPSLDGRIATLGRQVGGADKARAMFIARQPMGRLGTAEEMAAVAVYLASDESAFTTGSAIVADGGFTL
jgi:2-keto-3-deoxy-L-fuconate dehydrogenase